MIAQLKRISWKAGLVATCKAILTFTIVLAASGSLDTTFSGDGKQTTRVDTAHPNWDNRGFSMARQSDDKIVVVGSDKNANFALARYNSNGSLDSTFSGDGKLITDLGTTEERALGVAIQSNGKIVVVGDRCDGTQGICYVAVVRYNPNGSLDATFNGTGKKVVSWNGLSTSVTGGVAIQSDGKIVVGAGAPDASLFDLAVMRFNPNGSFDTTFNGTGKKKISFGPGIGSGGGWGQNLAIQSDGKIVIAGATSNNYFAIARLNSNGSFDTSFSGDGKQATYFGGTVGVWALALQPDGKIVVVGSKDTGTASYFAAARYHTNGTLDTTFNGTGKKLIGFAGSVHNVAASVVVQTNGKIVVCGFAAELHNGDLALARLNPNGSLDATFSGDGRATYDFNGGEDGCRRVEIDSHGRYVLAGRATVNGVIDFAVARVLP